MFWSTSSTMHTYNPSPPELPCSNMYTFAFLPPDLLKTELKLIVYGTDRRRTRKKCKIHKTFSALLHFISPKNFYITKELLYPQRTFISPISFYITNQTFISPNNFYQKICKKKMIKFFALNLW